MDSFWTCLNLLLWILNGYIIRNTDSSLKMRGERMLKTYYFGVFYTSIGLEKEGYLIHKVELSVTLLGIWDSVSFGPHIVSHKTLQFHCYPFHIFIHWSLNIQEFRILLYFVTECWYDNQVNSLWKITVPYDLTFLL